MWMLFSLMDRIYRRKKSSGKVLLAKVISIIVLVGVNMYQKPLLNICAFLFTSIINEKLLYERVNKLRFVYTISVLFLAGLSEELTWIVFDLYIKAFKIQMNTQILSFIRIVVCSLGSICVLKVSLNRISKHEVEYLEKSQKLACAFCIINSIITVHTLMIISQYQKNKYTLLFVAYCIAAQLILAIFIPEIIEFFSKYNRMNAEISVKHEKDKLQYNYYSLLEKKNEESQKLLHDIKNHMQILELSNKFSYDLDETYYNQLLENIERMEMPCFSSNKLLNILATDKYQISLRNNIDFIWKEDVDLYPIADFDIITIMGNLLDNAINACCDIESGRRIEVIIRKRNNTIHIYVNNSKGEENNIKQNRKGTGIGCINIRDTVEKYCGNYEVISGTDQYEAYISIPICIR